MSVLKEVDFRRFWTASFAGELGSQLAVFGLSVTAVTTLNASAAELGVVVAAGQLPWLLSLIAGVWVDRWRRRRVLLTVSAVRLLALASVFVAYAAGRLSIWQLVAVGLCLGIVEVFYLTAHDAFARTLVGRDRVSEARARLEVGTQSASAAGPALAGQIATLTAGPVVYVVAATVEAFSLVFLARTRANEAAASAEARDPFWKSLWQGLRFVLVHPLLRLLMLRNALINLAAGAVMAVLPLIVLVDLGISAAVFGAVVAVGAIAGIASGIVAFRIIRIMGELRTMLIFPLFLPVGLGCVAASGLGSLQLAIVLLVVAEIVLAGAVTIGAVAASGVRAKVTPERMMGRVSSGSRFVTMSATPVGALLAGALGSFAGPFTVAWLAVAVMSVAALVGVINPYVTSREVPVHLMDASDDTFR